MFHVRRMRNIFPLLLFLVSINLSSANTYNWKDLQPPSTSDVIAFSNEKPPSTGIRNLKEETEILEFLRRGAVFYSKNALNDYIKDNLPGVKLYDRDFPRSKGVIATKDSRIIYWTVMSEHVLQLETANVEICFLLYLDKWTQEAVDELKKYQYSNQAGSKTHTSINSERIQVLENSILKIKNQIDHELKKLEQFYNDYQSATENQQKALKAAVDHQRMFVESLKKRMMNMEQALFPLKLQMQYPTSFHHSY